MSKSVELLLKEALEANASQAKALTEKVESLANDGNTYTDRMKKMEDSLHAAMKQVVSMDASIKDFHKLMQGKLGELEGKYAAISVQKDDADMEEGEDTAETKDEDNVEVEKKPTDKAKATDKSKVVDEGAIGDGEKDEETESETEEEIESPDVQNKEVEEGIEEHEGGKGKPHKSAENSIGGINPTLNTVDKKTKLKKGAGAPMGKPEPKVVEKDDVTEIDEESNKKFTKGKKAQESVSSIAEQLNSKIESAIEKLASVTAKPSTEVTQLNEKLALESKAKEEALNHFKALNEKFESLMAKVSSLEKSEKTIEQKAAQIVASNGVEAVAISVDTPTVASKTDADVMKEFEALTGTEQRAFYLANKQSIERHASSILRGKRS